MRPTNDARAAPARAERDLTSPRNKWPAEFRDGARCAFLRQFDGNREKGGYPLGFHRWPLDRRNAWFAGFNVGFHDRLKLMGPPPPYDILSDPTLTAREREEITRVRRLLGLRRG
jgi:hypothetical protein